MNSFVNVFMFLFSFKLVNSLEIVRLACLEIGLDAWTNPICYTCWKPPRALSWLCTTMQTQSRSCHPCCSLSQLSWETPTSHSLPLLPRLSPSRSFCSLPQFPRMTPTELSCLRSQG